MSNANYIGRFAPSPTGHLHFGSLVTAVASYFQAKSNHGKWLVRIENIDPERELKGAAAAILHSLEAHHLNWDDKVVYQSDRIHFYQHAVTELHNLNVLYRCQCSRKIIKYNIKKLQLQNVNAYPGTCRDLCLTNKTAHSIRLRVSKQVVQFTDKLHGIQLFKLHESGDFVIQKADRTMSYQLAVAIDDHLQNITEVVRGIDLMASSARQILIMQLLHNTIPQYCHIPVVLNSDGSKLSKQTGAQRLSLSNTQLQLWNALYFLNQVPPLSLKNGSLHELHDWALQHWELNKIHKQSVEILSP